MSKTLRGIFIFLVLAPVLSMAEEQEVDQVIDCTLYHGTEKGDQRKYRIEVNKGVMGQDSVPTYFNQGFELEGERGGLRVSYFQNKKGLDRLILHLSYESSDKIFLSDQGGEGPIRGSLVAVAPDLGFEVTHVSLQCVLNSIEQN